MDVASNLLGAITGGANVKIEIVLNKPDNPNVVPLDHYPSWKLHKNPFWRVKHPQGSKQQQQQQQQQQLAPPPTQQQQQQPQQPQMSPYMNNTMQDPNYPQQQQQPQMYNGMQDPNFQQQQQQHAMPPNSQQQQFAPPGNYSDQSSMAMSMNPPELISEGLRQAVVAYEASQDVSGIVRLRIPPGKKLEHLGIKIQFIGRIDMGQGVHEGRPHYDFVSLSKELSPPGVLYNTQTEIPFVFRNMDKEHESYKGRNVAVRYFVKVVLERKFLPPVHKEHDIWVQIMGTEPSENEAIKMEVGIEDCLHIEFEYERRVFHLQDTIIGKIHFMLVRIKIKHMELAVIRRETSGEGVASQAGGSSSSRGAPVGSAVDVNNICTETQTLVKYEIMDGAPVKGEVIPVKLGLRGIPCDLTPTYTAVNNRFSVRYFLNLVLVDAEDRRYFKQQEIILWRKELG